MLNASALHLARVPVAGVVVVVAVVLVSLLGGDVEARQAGAGGGNGGAPFELKCRSYAGLLGYYAYYGKALDQIFGTCADVRPDKTLNKSNNTFSAGNITVATSRQGLSCPPNTLVFGMRVHVDKFDMVSKVDLHCKNIQTGATTDLLGRTEGGPVSTRTIRCEPGEVGVGYYGRSGARIDQIGLLCEKLTVIQPQLASQPGPAPAPPKGEGFCRSYAIVMTERANQAKALPNCPTRWSTSNDANYSKCMATTNAASALVGDRAEIDGVIARCKASASGGGGGGTQQKTTRATEPTDIYDKPPPQNGGNDTKKVIGSMRLGQRTNLIACRADKWCQTSLGWVWGEHIQPGAN